jgi:hypothetical protein
MELDVELAVEREANRASFRVTHWVVPSVPARSPREARVMRALSDYHPFVHLSNRKCGLDNYGRPDETVWPIVVRKKIIMGSTEGNVAGPDRDETVGLNVYRK